MVQAQKKTQKNKQGIGDNALSWLNQKAGYDKAKMKVGNLLKLAGEARADLEENLPKIHPKRRGVQKNYNIYQSAVMESIETIEKTISKMESLKKKFETRHPDEIAAFNRRLGILRKRLSELKQEAKWLPREMKNRRFRRIRKVLNEEIADISPRTDIPRKVAKKQKNPAAQKKEKKARVKVAAKKKPGEYTISELNRALEKAITGEMEASGAKERERFHDLAVSLWKKKSKKTGIRPPEKYRTGPRHYTLASLNPAIEKAIKAEERAARRGNAAEAEKHHYEAVKLWEIKRHLTHMPIPENYRRKRARTRVAKAEPPVYEMDFTKKKPGRKARKKKKPEEMVFTEEEVFGRPRVASKEPSITELKKEARELNREIKERKKAGKPIAGKRRKWFETWEKIARLGGTGVPKNVRDALKKGGKRA